MKLSRLVLKVSMKLLLHIFLTSIVNLLGDKSHHFKAIQNAVLCKKVDCYERFPICIQNANIKVFAMRKKQNTHNRYFMIIALIIKSYRQQCYILICIQAILTNSTLLIEITQLVYKKFFKL